MDIVTLPVHQPEKVDPIINHSVPMLVRTNDKKKNHNQRRITQQCVVKEDDPDTAMVCITGARRDGGSARLTAQSSNPFESE